MTILMSCLALGSGSAVPSRIRDCFFAWGWFLILRSHSSRMRNLKVALKLCSCWFGSSFTPRFILPVKQTVRNGSSCSVFWSDFYSLSFLFPRWWVRLERFISLPFTVYGGFSHVVQLHRKILPDIFPTVFTLSWVNLKYLLPFGYCGKWDLLSIIITGYLFSSFHSFLSEFEVLFALCLLR